jgi:hypothetical protein
MKTSKRRMAEDQKRMMEDMQMDKEGYRGFVRIVARRKEKQR